MPWRDAAPLQLTTVLRRAASRHDSPSQPDRAELDQLAACLIRLARAFDRDGTGLPSAGLLLDERA
jgi:hypothetical protein